MVVLWRNKRMNDSFENVEINKYGDDEDDISLKEDSYVLDCIIMSSNNVVIK